MKPDNILLNADSGVKIADFGLCREFRVVDGGGCEEMSEYVATRWYRAPELLFGSSHYGTGIDVWGLGCIFGELLCGEVLFRGVDQMDMVHFQCCPCCQILPDVAFLCPLCFPVPFVPCDRLCKPCPTGLPQLRRIFALLGSPREDTLDFLGSASGGVDWLWHSPMWKGKGEVKGAGVGVGVGRSEGSGGGDVMARLKEAMPLADDPSLDLLQQLLAADPRYTYPPLPLCFLPSFPLPCQLHATKYRRPLSPNPLLSTPNKGAPGTTRDATYTHITHTQRAL